MAAKKTATKGTTVEFEFERSTKNKHRYAEVADEPVIGTLYVGKSALGEDAPETLTVTIKVG